MENKNKKKKGSNPLGVIFIIVVALLGMFGESMDSPELIIVAVVGLALLVGIIIGAVYLIKKRAAGEQKEEKIFSHSHDRLNKQYNGCSVDEHWKVQLDSFLESGIIDRKEYAVLLEKHGKAYDRTST